MFVFLYLRTQNVRDINNSSLSRSWCLVPYTINELVDYIFDLEPKTVKIHNIGDKTEIVQEVYCTSNTRLKTDDR